MHYVRRRRYHMHLPTPIQQSIQRRLPKIQWQFCRSSDKVSRTGNVETSKRSKPPSVPFNQSYPFISFYILFIYIYIYKFPFIVALGWSRGEFCLVASCSFAANLLCQPEDLFVWSLVLFVELRGVNSAWAMVFAAINFRFKSITHFWKRNRLLNRSAG